MNIQEFKQRAGNDLERLVPVRKIAYENGTDFKVSLFSGEYWDLLSFYKNQWHYITTVKNKG